MEPHPVIPLVDDEVRSQETLHRMLTDEFDVLTASNAYEAEEILKSEMVHLNLVRSAHARHARC